MQREATARSGRVHALLAHLPQRTDLAPLVLLLAGVISYANSLQGVFLLDDRIMIEEHPANGTLPWQGLINHPRGLVDLSFRANYLAGGLDPLGYHVVNVAIHLCAGLALFGLVRRTLASPRLAGRYGAASTPLALAIALVWLVHPLATQGVTYITQRYESAAALFCFLAFYSFRRGLDSSARANAWYAAVVVCYLLALRSKETAIVLPVLLVWYDRALVASSWRELLTRKYLYLALAGVLGLLQGQRLLGDLSIWGQQLVVSDAQAIPKQTVLVVDGFTPWRYFLSQQGVLVHYLRLCLLPSGQCFDYGWKAADTPDQYVPPLLLMLAFGLGTLWAVWKWPGWGFLGGVFFVYLAPTSSFLPIQDLAVEHRMYLPLAAVVTALVLLGHGLWRWVLERDQLSQPTRHLLGWLGPAMLVLTILTFGAETIMRNRTYRSALTVWEQVARTRPDFWRGHHLYAKALCDERDYEGCLRELTQAIELSKTVADCYATRGTLYVRMRRYADAERDFTAALELDDNLPSTHYNRGMVYLDTKHYDQAIVDCSRAIELKPDYAMAYLGRGEIYAAQGKFGQAEVDYRRSLALDPTSERARRALLELRKQNEPQAESSPDALGANDAATGPLPQAVRP